MQKLFFRTACAVVAAGVALPAVTLKAGEPAISHESNTLYRLNENAEYLEGCFDPCACPISLSAIGGTFVLGPEMIGDAFNFREVREVNWVVTRGNQQFTVEGGGGYYISNFGAPPVHSLELDLSIDGGPVQHFFSDPVPVTSNDGSIDITVSINGMYCYDIAIRVAASPVTNHFTHYFVGDPSTYQHGCWDPCDCPLEAPRAMRGSFDLAALTISNSVREFAVTEVRLIALADNNMQPPVILTGYGRYTVTTVQGQTTQRLTLTLYEDGSSVGPMHYDSGGVPVETTFPRIAIVVDMNGQVCLDTVLDIRARPIHNNATLGASKEKAGPGMQSP